MYRHLPINRNQRSQGFRLKHVLQICVLAAVCFWLTYQVKHSHDKRKQFDENNSKISHNVERNNAIMKLGRKDLNPQEKGTNKDDEEVEEETIDGDKNGEENGKQDTMKEETEEEDKHEKDSAEEQHEEETREEIKREEETREEDEHEETGEGKLEEGIGDEDKNEEETEEDIEAEEKEDEGRGDGDNLEKGKEDSIKKESEEKDEQRLTVQWRIMTMMKDLQILVKHARNNTTGTTLPLLLP